MDKIREWSFPVALLTAWVGVAAYTLSSLGEAQARVMAAQMPTLRAPAVEIAAPAAAHAASLAPSPAPKKVARRGPRV